ncbi:MULTISPECIES: nitrile hydratase accessory protein [unclassified Mycobacterium]|uniref:nitrile hydratase accessory protein n=1 Tax=unclassified Mycobacterium TaxID=2642494 RepID=UPI0029C6B849|nr:MULTISPECIES: nitrile hydratase accessory protein [unclassified Mycobacterium]
MSRPAFSAPWEARAFAMVRALQNAELVTPGEWATALGAAIRCAQATGDPVDGSTYYEHWLAALEQLVVQKDLTTDDAMSRYRAAWADAASRTPHGKPIELAE